jgi:hypothetical protein
MWDEGAGPLWRDEGLLPDDPEWLREALGLSDSLIADLLAWVRYMDEARDRGQSQAPLDNRALQLTRRLQIEVGSRCGSDSTRSRCASGSAFGLVARLYAEYERPDLPRVCHKRRLVPSITCRCSSDHTDKRAPVRRRSGVLYRLPSHAEAGYLARVQGIVVGTATNRS